jgi:hypothetical protein
MGFNAGLPPALGPTPRCDGLPSRAETRPARHRVAGTRRGPGPSHPATSEHGASHGSWELRTWGSPFGARQKGNTHPRRGQWSPSGNSARGRAALCWPGWPAKVKACVARRKPSLDASRPKAVDTCNRHRQRADATLPATGVAAWWNQDCVRAGDDCDASELDFRTAEAAYEGCVNAMSTASRGSMELPHSIRLAGWHSPQESDRTTCRFTGPVRCTASRDSWKPPTA